MNLCNLSVEKLDWFSFSRQAVEYVTHQIVTLGSPQLKVLTSQGSLLSSLTFRAEITNKVNPQRSILAILTVNV